MTKKPKSRAQLSEAIEAARSKQKRLLKKVASTQAKLEKRTRRLRRVEAQLAQLERRSHAERSTGNARAQAGNGKLKPIHVIYNPKSGGAQDITLESIIAALRSHGLRADVDVKTSARDARERASVAADNEESLVIVAGGDSTVEEVAPALCGTKTALGILPIGTMNNIARSLGVPLELDDACALLAAGSTRRIDMGHIITEGKKGADYFLETAGLGLTAIAFSAGKAAQKGPLAGLPRALQKFFDSKPDAVEVELDDGQKVVASAQLVTVSNAPLMGLNFLIAPDAKMDDGLLDIAIYDGMGKAELVDYFMAMKDGKRAENPRVRFFRSRIVRIKAATALAVDSDKNPLADERSLQIEVLPQALSMVVGRGIALTLPVEAAPAAAVLSRTRK